MAQMLSRNLGYSLKNIPISSRNCYLKSLISQTESFLKRLRWRVFWYTTSDENTPHNPKENFKHVFKSDRTPPQHHLLANFESDMYSLIGNIKFKNSQNEFQDQINKDIKELKSGGRVIVEADKTSNLYHVSPDYYRKLLHENVTKNYKVAPQGTQESINKRTNIIAEKIGVNDRMECYSESPCFVSLKDHKENFYTNPTCRLINPAKTNLGSVSKEILERIIVEVKNRTNFNQWKSTFDVLDWFKNIGSLKKHDSLSLTSRNFTHPYQQNF